MEAEKKNIKLAKEAFIRLKKRAKELHIEKQDLTKLSALDVFIKRRSYRPFIVLISVLILPAIASFASYKSIGEETRLYFMKMFADKVLNIELEKEICLLPNVELYLDLFRPPVNCSVCEHFATIDVVSGLSKEVFLEKYAYTARPVVIRDGCKNWSALSHFTYDFFKNMYPPNSPVLQSVDRDCQFFPYRTNFESLGEVFNMSKSKADMEGDPWYIGWSNCDSSTANLLRKHYQKPYFLPDDSESSRTDWIFMGCPGYGAHLHIDAVGKPSWQAQIKGTKQWTLEPPPECFFKCRHIHKITVEPGDIIVLDTNKWFHQTTIIGSEMSITIGSEYD